MSRPDRPLIEKARKGDRASFDSLVEKHYTLVFNTAYRMLGDRDGAEDATQSAFVRAYCSLDRFRGNAAFSTWLYRIVTNVCLDMIRARRDDVDSLEMEYRDNDTRHRPLPDESAEPARHVEHTQLQQLVHEAMATLSPQYRAVIVLYDIRGFAYDQIAEILDVPLGTVKSRLNRARLALKEEIGSDVELFTR